MATFKFGRTVDIHWNGFEVVGPADTVFSIPDQLYEEFEADFRAVEPSLVWIDTNEFQTLENQVSTAVLSADLPISITTSTTGKTISLNSGTALNGYLLVADGAGGTIWNPASTSGINSVVGVSPISSTISGGTVSVSLDASYQTAGTYVNAVIGTSPASVVTASGTSTVSIDQAAITGATAATNAQTVRTYVKNTTGSTIAIGKAVYVSGATGDNALISLSTASTEVGSSKTLGITAESIANDAFGYVVESGYLTGIDTTGISAGTSIWLGTNPGSLVFGAPPAEPNHSVYLGVVIREQQNNGSILVKVQNGYELDELHDVSVGSPTDLDIIQYKSSSSLWTKSSIAGAGIAASVHTHDYQASGTYVNAVIGTSPASVSTASGTSTVSIIASSINSTHIADNAIVASKIAAGAVGSAAIAAGAVNTSAINSGSATSGQILQANGSGGATFSNVSVSGTQVLEQLTGTGTWIRPSGVNFIDVTILGSGGGGGGGGLAYKHSGSESMAAGGGGGASGRFYTAFNIYVGSSTSFSYSVGAGGTGGASRTYVQGAGVTKADQALTGNNGATGGSTTFGSIVSVSGAPGGSGGLTSLTATAPGTSAGGGASNFNGGLYPYPNLSKGPSAGGVGADSGNAGDPSTSSTSVADWYINGVLEAGSEDFNSSFGILPSSTINQFVSITAGSATISTTAATTTYTLGIGGSTDSTFNSGNGPVGGGGAGGSRALSTSENGGNGARTQSPSGPGGGGAGIYISTSSQTVTMSSGNGASGGGSWGLAGGGGGGGCTMVTSSATVSNTASVNLTSGAGGNGSDAVMYIRYQL